MTFRAYTISAVAALALAAPAAQGAVLTPADGATASAATHYSAAALKAVGLRYQAMANAYNEPCISKLGSSNLARGQNPYNPASWGQSCPQANPTRSELRSRRTR